MTPVDQTRAVILLSGGLDSATCLAIAREAGYSCYALSFRYGQRHAAELEAASRVAQAVGVERHLVVDFDLRAIGGSALTDQIAVPKGRSGDEIGEGIPVTYVPARNTIFLAFALSWCEVLHCRDIFIGVNALDYSGYPDCRPAFIEAFEQLARQATAMGAERGEHVRIHAPLIDLTKGQIIRRGLALGLDYGLTLSCYDPAPDGRPCGACDACLLRRRGFAEAGEVDPARPAGGA
jgi:7-cyano-7-deazaguanine synthase